MSLTTSYKNKLQHYLQTNKLKQIDYITTRVGGNDHFPIWQSIIKYDNKEFKSDEKNNKRDAEQHVAMLVYDYLWNDKNNHNEKKRKETKLNILHSIYDIPNLLDFKSIVLLDVENIIFDKKIKKNVLYLAFVAKNTNKRWIFDEKYDNLYIFVSESLGKDASDFLLTLYLGKLTVLMNKNTKYIVFTKDHYGDLLTSFVDNCSLVCSNEELNQKLE